MQALPLEAKINMTKERIRAWYESWVRFEIHNDKTGKTRFVTMDCRDYGAEPQLKEGEWIVSALPGAVYVSFSGGKDSTVLKHIVDNTPGVYDVPAVFVNTGLEYPEIQRFVKDVQSGRWDCFNSDVVIVRPEMRFDEVIKKYGYPVISKEVAHSLHEVSRSRKKGKTGTRREKRLLGELKDANGNPSMFNQAKYAYLLDADFDASHICCHVMKKAPAKAYEKETGRKAIIGTLANESLARKQAWIKNGCNAFESTRPTSQPLSFWTKQDILHYTQKFNVPYCPVYGDIVVDLENDAPDEQINIFDYLGDYEPEDKLKTTGCDRTGCIFCMFGCHLEGTPNRFQRLKKTHPRQYEYCIGGGEMVDGKWQPSKEGLGLCKVLDYIGVEYE